MWGGGAPGEGSLCSVGSTGAGSSLQRIRVAGVGDLPPSSPSQPPSGGSLAVVGVVFFVCYEAEMLKEGMQRSERERNVNPPGGKR